ncbi:MAG: hypothetical protein ACRDRA_14690 [Pseudonocardiaceae bacterium]
MATTAKPQEFDPHPIDAYWTEVWEKEQSWVIDNDANAANSVYVLEMRKVIVVPGRLVNVVVT